MPIFPIQYLEGNLIKNHLDEWYAYYRLEAYDYSFVSPQEKLNVFSRLQQLIGQIKVGNIQMLMISTESSVRAAQERSKALVQGNLKDVALKTIDQQSAVLIDGDWMEEKTNEQDIPFYSGETEIDYCFYIGFKLVPNQIADMKQALSELVGFWTSYLNGVSRALMNDYVTVSNAEFERYSRLERLTHSKISVHFRFHRVSPKEIGYIVEHIYGSSGTAFEDFLYRLPVVRQEESTQVKRYDLLKLSNCLVQETPKYIRYVRDGQTAYCAYLAMHEVTEELTFPGSELLYFQQLQFDFPVDASIRLTVIEHPKALSKVRNKKKQLKDIDDHAWQTGNEAGGHVAEALETIFELETDLASSKDSMFELSYLLRVSANSEDELERRVASLMDYYSGGGIKLVRPAGDMLNFHMEFIPSSPRSNEIINRVKGDFPACIGFGANQMIGEKEGIFVGYTKYGGKCVYLQPWIASQGVSGSITNSLSAAFIGTLGYGKSFNHNLLLYHSVLFGAKAVVIDPKSERGLWKETLPDIAHEINLIKLTGDEVNKGILDPFLIMHTDKDAQNLALDLLSYLLGVTIQDSGKFPALRKAIRTVSKRERRGLLFVIDALREQGDSISNALADHIESFTDSGLASLLFSDGMVRKQVDFTKRLNIIQIADLKLPDSSVHSESYTTAHKLSVAMMIAVSTFSLNFIHGEPNVFKIVDIDEAWSLLNIPQGKELAERLIREGRSMNAGIWLSSQSVKDVSDEIIRNNLGMIFVFHSNDDEEIRNSLELLGVDRDDSSNIRKIRNLGIGECVMRDIRGHVNTVKFEYLIPFLKRGFNTTPTREESVV